MRLFVGISIPQDVEARLRALVDALRPLAVIKWSRIDGLHLTVKFIGEQAPSRVRDISSLLQSVTNRAPFELAIRGIGWFPNARAPRVLWAGVHPLPALTDLAADTERTLETLGLPRERRVYAPHVTLARVPQGSHLERLRQHLAQGPPPEFGGFTVEQLTLYESRRGRATDAGQPVHHEYHALERFSLRVRPAHASETDG